MQLIRKRIFLILLTIFVISLIFFVLSQFLQPGTLGSGEEDIENVKAVSTFIIIPSMFFLMIIIPAIFLNRDIYKWTQYKYFITCKGDAVRVYFMKTDVKLYGVKVAEKHGLYIINKNKKRYSLLITVKEREELAPYLESYFPNAVIGCQ